MEISIKGNRKLTKSLLKLPSEVSKNFSRDIKDDIKDAIIDEIESGRSPVRGKRFKRYSQSYRDVINSGKIPGKRETPVNLKVTGKLLKSLIVKQVSRSGDLVIRFTNPVAKYHNELGASVRKVIRRMLPTRKGELFNLRITKLIDKVLERAVKKSVKRI